jgi:hypothetical protein
MRVRIFRCFVQCSKWRPCFRSVLRKSAVLLFVFYGHKHSVQGILIKECFLITMERVYRLKLFTAGNTILSRTFEWSTCARPGEEVTETEAKILLRCGFFRCTAKALCENMRFFFQVLISHTLRLVPVCDLSTDSLSLPHHDTTSAPLTLCSRNVQPKYRS